MDKLQGPSVAAADQKEVEENGEPKVEEEHKKPIKEMPPTNPANLLVVTNIESPRETLSGPPPAPSYYPSVQVEGGECQGNSHSPFWYPPPPVAGTGCHMLHEMIYRLPHIQNSPCPTPCHHLHLQLGSTWHGARKSSCPLIVFPSCSCGMTLGLFPRPSSM